MRRIGVFAPKTSALSHAEAVLLVDNHQTEVAELHHIFKQSMGADNDLQRAIEEVAVYGFALFFASGTGEQGAFNAQRLHQMADGIEMLCSENLGGCHDGSLIIVVERQKHAHKGHESFAAAHIALKETIHLSAAAHIGANLLDNSLLSAGECKGQMLGVESIEIMPHAREHKTA